MRDLAARLAALPGWKWPPGVLVAQAHEGYGYPLRVMAYVRHSDGCDRIEGAYHDVGGTLQLDSILAEGRIPDLTDHGTLGCLLALVREALGRIPVWVECQSDGVWMVYAMADGARGFVWSGDTEAHALVAALEAAP